MDDNKDKDIHVAHELVQAVENAWNLLQSYLVDQHQKKAADTAMSRINIYTTAAPSDQGLPWEHVVTTTELDKEA
jgi:hypothetical protein